MKVTQQQVDLINQVLWTSKIGPDEFSQHMFTSHDTHYVQTQYDRMNSNFAKFWFGLDLAYQRAFIAWARSRYEKKGK